VLDSEVYILGPEVEAFERAFADYCGVNCAVGVANGTDALFLALKELGIGPGDEVITVSHTAVATALATQLRRSGQPTAWRTAWYGKPFAGRSCPFRSILN
jgi:dTDP-4-amino-4,6-dideoxygalactose transaminase